MNKRFPLLSIISIAMRIMGALVFFAGIYGSVSQAAALTRCLPDCGLDSLWLFTNLGMLIGGCLVMMIGEIVGVLFSIESNMYRLVELSQGKAR